MFDAWQHSRLWLTLLWALTLAVGLAGWDWAERRMAAGEGLPPVLLLPDREPNEEQRRELAQQFAGEPGIASARWLAPDESARRLAGRLEDDRWRALLPDERTSWIPWMLEARPSHPLGGVGSLEAFVARRRQEGEWGVFWDAGPARRLLQERRWLRGFVGLALALAGLAGAAGLRTSAWPRPGGRGVWVWSAALGTVAPLAVAAGAWLVGAPVDARAAIVAAAAGFALAAAVAPMLRHSEIRDAATTFDDPLSGGGMP